MSKEMNCRRELYYIRQHFSFKLIIKVAMKMLKEEQSGERFKN